MHVLVDVNPTQFAYFQSGGFGKLYIGSGADTEHHHIAGYLAAILQSNYGLSIALAEISDSDGKHYLNRVRPQGFLHLLCHLRVQWGQHLVQHLNHCYFHAAVLQIFCHFQAYVSAADNYRFFRFLPGNEFQDFVGISKVTQYEDTFGVDSGQGRSDGAGSRRQDESIIGLKVFLTGSNVNHFYLPGIRHDCFDLRLYPYFNAEPAFKVLGSGNCHETTVFNHTAYEIGKAAMCVGDVLAPLEHDYFGIFVETTGPGGCRGATGTTAND